MVRDFGSIALNIIRLLFILPSLEPFITILTSSAERFWISARHKYPVVNYHHRTLSIRWHVGSNWKDLRFGNVVLNAKANSVYSSFLLGLSRVPTLRHVSLLFSVARDRSPVGLGSYCYFTEDRSQDSFSFCYTVRLCLAVYGLQFI